MAALLIAEAAVRLWQGVPLLATGNFIDAQLDLIRQNTGVMVHDPQLGWRLTDNLQLHGFTTGLYGLRMPTGDIRAPAAGAVLAVGDSFTAGSGVLDDASWPAQLERMLGRQVHNGAAGAWGVDQMVLRAEQLVPSLKPAVLIVSVLGQDSLRNSYDLYGGGYKPYFDIEDGGAVLKGVPAPQVAARPLALGWWRQTLGRSLLVHTVMMRAHPTLWVHDTLRYRRVHSNEVGVEISCHLMDRLARLRREYGLRVVVAMQYAAGESSGTKPPWYGPPVLQCARERGFDTVDTFPPLKTLADRDRKAFETLWLNEGGQLGHMSPDGNRLVASLFHALLRSR